MALAVRDSPSRPVPWQKVLGAGTPDLLQHDPLSTAPILRPANPAKLRSVSAPTKKRPNSLAATPVVADPLKAVKHEITFPGGVEPDEDSGRDIVRKTGQKGVPVIKIGSRWIVGFDKDQIEKELARKAS